MPPAKTDQPVHPSSKARVPVHPSLGSQGRGCRRHMPPARTDQPVHPASMARVFVHPSLDRRHKRSAKTLIRLPGFRWWHMSYRVCCALAHLVFFFFLVQIPLSSVVASTSHFLICTLSCEPVVGFFPNNIRTDQILVNLT